MSEIRSASAMSVVGGPPVQQDTTPGTEPASASMVAGLREEVRRQGRSIHATQQAFSIFAVLALAIAMASLVAIALKLQEEPRTITAAAPAASASTVTATAAPLSRNVDVTLAQFAVSPSQPAAPHGPVTFRVHNAGTIVHEFVVIRSPRAAADLPIVKGRASEAGNIGETGDLRPGTTKSVTLKLTGGHYALICNLPGHYLAGQHTDFTVR